jgi:hypothetical protein
VVVFCAALPTLAYAFLVAIWAIRLGQKGSTAYR